MLAMLKKKGKRITMTFGERLRQLREAAGLTQEGLARNANMSLSAISKMELKNIDPSWSTVQRLARALAVGVAAFDTDQAPHAEQMQDGAPRRKKK